MATPIRFHERFAQGISFEGLAWGESGKLRPTDIDCVIEMRGRLLVLVEVKHVNVVAAGCTGQRVAIERLCDAWAQSGQRPAYGLVATHSTPSSQLIRLASCDVWRVRQARRTWREPQRQTNVADAIDALFAMHGFVDEAMARVERELIARHAVERQA